MTRSTAAVAVLAALVSTSAVAAPSASLAAARAILDRVPLVDGHNDLPWEFRERFKGALSGLDIATDQSRLEETLHTDIPRLERGGVGAQFWSVYVPASVEPLEAVVTTLEQIDFVKRLSERYPDTFELALSASDIRRIHGEGKIASLAGIEGGHCIASSLGVLRQMYAAGARYMTLTHSATIPWADSATDEARHGGLTPFGREVVREMNRLGMLVDLSHTSVETMRDALEVAAAPVIFSHSSARALNGHPRNVPDEILRLLPENGGIIMVTFVPPFISERNRLHYAERDAAEARFKALHPGEPSLALAKLDRWIAANPAPRATLSEVADHIDHIRGVAGVDHIDIGSDFDGISTTPEGLEDVSTFPALFAELLGRGYSETDVAKIAGLNALRVLDRAQQIAKSLQASRLPSEALIEELDGSPPGAGSSRP
ncbi:MAG: dipeptidase [Thermoanaerobaculia bacterium]